MIFKCLLEKICGILFIFCYLMRISITSLFLPPPSSPASKSYEVFLVGWNGNFWACLSKPFTAQPPEYFQFSLLFSLLCPRGPHHSPPHPVFTTSAFALRLLPRPRMPFLLSRLHDKLLSLPEDPSEMLPVFISHSASFLQAGMSPTCAPIRSTLNDSIIHTVS